MYLFSLIFLGILITIVLIILWKKSQTTVNEPRKYRFIKKFEIRFFFVLATVAYLRWNATGITLFGTTSIQGNTSSQLYHPFGLVLNSFNDFYVADRKNNRIQKCRIG
jgi:hypothetical protein